MRERQVTSEIGCTLGLHGFLSRSTTSFGREGCASGTSRKKVRDRSVARLRHSSARNWSSGHGMHGVVKSLLTSISKALVRSCAGRPRRSFVQGIRKEHHRHAAKLRWKTTRFNAVKTASMGKKGRLPIRSALGHPGTAQCCHARRPSDRRSGRGSRKVAA